MSDSVYHCSKCDTAISMNRTPNAGNCKGGSGSHYWIALGSSGSESYQCSKCNITVQTNRTPNAASCSSGGSHLWRAL